MNNSPALACFRSAARITGALLCSGALAQTASTVPTGSDRPKDEVTILTPFEVNVAKDRGYAASETLSGSRLNTKIEDTGVAETILTPEFMQDLGLTSIDQTYDFVPNTTADQAALGANANNNALFNAVSYTSRGFSVTSSQRDFLPTVVPADMYNTERISFTRGPNAILYGLGNPGGIANSVSQRADVRRNSLLLDVTTDSNEGLRLAANANVRVVPGKLGVRVARLDDDRGTYWKPDSNKNRRTYVAVRIQPWSKTIINANYEWGTQRRRALPRGQTYSDGFSTWTTLPAGSRPVVAKAGTVLNNNTVAGLDSISTTLRVIGGATTAVPVMNWQRMGEPEVVQPNISNTIHSVSDHEPFPLPLPLDTNIMGYASATNVNFRSFMVNAQQEILPHLDLDVTFDRQWSDRFSENSARASNDTLFIDPNSVLPDGSPNPNFGKFYYEADGNLFTSTGRITVGRATMSYEFDAKAHWPKWGAWIGRHRFAALLERQESNTNGINSAGLRNLTPALAKIAGVAAKYPNTLNTPANAIIYRYYLDPAAGVTHLPSVYEQFPYLATSDNIGQILASVAPDANGVTPGYANIGVPTVNFVRTNARMFAMQDYWLKERVITLFGWRQDKRDLFSLNLPRNAANGLYPDPHNFNAKGNPASDATYQSGDTFTRGVVLVATPWLRLFYNESDSFLPQDPTATDLYGRPIGNAKGKGTELGARLALFHGRVNASVSRWTSDMTNQATAIIRNQLGLFNFNNAVITLWNEAADLSGDAKYLSPPYRLAQNFTDYFDNVAEGYEFSVVANPTPNWRLLLNGGTQTNKQSNLGPVLQQYWAEFSPVWRNFPSRDLNGNGKIDPATPTTPDDQREQFLDRSGGTDANSIAQLLDLGDAALARIKASSGISTASIPKWSANFMTNYRFSEGVLKGIGVGGNLGFSGPRTIGYVLNASGQYDRSAPINDGRTVRTGLWVSYERRLHLGGSHEVNWRIQLNVRNVLDDRDLEPITAMSDTARNPVVVRWSLPEPRTFVLRNTFEF